ncbi:MAG: hypothetical protein M1339_01895, partial [Bacteroidetes bacterium]|nr:hypothetical protein [Bacteroidota bacterium]
YDLVLGTFLQDSLQDVVNIGEGSLHTVVLTKDSTVWAWGQNELGQLGNGTYYSSSTPTKVKDLTGVVSISTNYWRA